MTSIEVDFDVYKVLTMKRETESVTYNDVLRKMLGLGAREPAGATTAGFVDTCFGTHHAQFGYDADDTLWFSGTGQVAGWVNTKTFDETGDAAKSQGWSPFVLDTNANGKRDEYSEPGKPTDPNKDMRIIPGSGPYAVMPNPADGSIWYTVGVFAGTPGFLRFDPKSGLSEIYNMPKPGFGIRGGDIDSKGVVWGSGSSGHLVSFDRSKCNAPLNGPNATGDHCPEGWAFYKYPGPGFDGFPNTSAETSYYTWVDQHNTLGLGNDLDRQSRGRLCCVQGWQHGPATHSLSNGLLCEGAGRAHRRSRCRLERPRTVEHQW
jgi:hypothetical protein